MTIALTRFERQAAHAAFGTIYAGPDCGTLPLGITDMDLDGYLDRTLNAIPLEPAVGLRLAIWLIALAPIFILRRFVTIVSLGVEDREKVIATLYASPHYLLRSAPIALKAIGALFYCGDLRLRPIIMGTQAQAASGPVVTLRKRSSSGEAGEHRDEQRRIA